MVWFLAAAAGLWALGAAFGAPVRARWLMIGLLYVGVLALLLVLPDGNGLATALGGSFGEWLVLGGLVALVAFYRRGLGWLRQRAQTPEPPPARPGAFTEVERERYARHIMLREIGGPGQKRLKEAKVLVIGAGGLGAPTILYLAAAGIGRIGVVDDDVVENTNLQRQVIHSDDRIGMPKVFSAQAAVEALNPFVELRPYNRRLDAESAELLVREYDLVLDGTDNFETRYMVNAACVAAGVPLISGAITQWEGQVALFDPERGGPCYACVFPEAPAPGLVPSCAEAGVAGPLPGVVGSIMALEAVKEIVDAGEGLRGRMMVHDGLFGENRVMRMAAREGCPVCGGRGLSN